MEIFVIAVFLTIAISASCSLFEAVLYSMRVATLEAKVAQNPANRLAKRALKMKQNISQPISAILILNTIANTAGTFVAGIYAKQLFSATWVAIFTALLILTILFFSEILPKTVGVVYWRVFWPIVIVPITITKWVLYPIVLLAQGFAHIFTSGKKMPTITDEEIKALAQVGANEGEITKTESNLVQNIIGLEDLSVREIMTPRTVIFSLNCEKAVSDAIIAADAQAFTRIPIFKETKEKIIGYVTWRDIRKTISEQNTQIKLEEIARPISFVPGVTNCLQSLISFTSQKSHLAIVIDEFGGVDGLVTMEDIIETMLGSEIVDENESIVDLQLYAKNLKGRQNT